MKKVVWRTFNNFRTARVRFINGLSLGKDVIITGSPKINIKKGGKISVGDDVTLNSKDKNYLLNMHSPVKLTVINSNASISIGDNTRIHGSSIYARERVEIGKNCLIAANTAILDSNGHDLSFEDIYNRVNTRGSSEPVVIEDCVWIGANSTILPGVTIGKGSVIAAGSIVTKDIPPMCIAGGSPAKVIRKYTSPINK